MVTIRRDTLRKMVEKGEMEGTIKNLRNDFHDDDWFPVRIKKNHDDFKNGYLNLTGFDFKAQGGSAHKNKDGTIRLSVHSNLWFDLRKR